MLINATKTLTQLKQIMKNTMKTLTLITALLFSLSVSAHERFILPSHTVLSGDKTQSVSHVASISNAIFHGDRPLGNNDKGIETKNLSMLFKRLHTVVIGPDGTSSKLSWQAFSRFSVADMQVEQSGTYRIAIVQPNTPMTTFKKSDGSFGRFFGDKGVVPEKATNVVRRTTASRVESYVSFNEPNRVALKPTGQGLELTGESHPNDLFTNELIRFQLHFQGEPLNEVTEVKLVQGATRHRNQRDEQIIKTDAQGRFSLTIKQAGFYLLSANVDVEGQTGSGIDIHHYGLYATLEVFPQ